MAGSDAEPAVDVGGAPAPEEKPGAPVEQPALALPEIRTGSTAPTLVAGAAVTRLHDQVFRRGPFVIEQVAFLNGAGEPFDTIHVWDELLIRLHYRCSEPPEDETLGWAFGIHKLRRCC